MLAAILENLPIRTVLTSRFSFKPSKMRPFTIETKLTKVKQVLSNYII